MNGTIIATAVRNHGITGFFDELLSVKVGNQLYKVPLPKAWAAQAFSEVATRVKAEHDATVVAIERGSETLVNPAVGMALEAEDHVVVIARREPNFG